MSYESYEQRSFPDGHGAPSMSYEVLHVKMDSLYDWVLNNQLDRYNGFSGWEGNYQELDISDWTIDSQYPDYTRIDKAYRLYYDSYPNDQWIICKDNLIIWLRADWKLTEEQIKTVVLRISRYYPIEYNDEKL